MDWQKQGWAVATLLVLPYEHPAVNIKHGTNDGVLLSGQELASMSAIPEGAVAQYAAPDGQGRRKRVTREGGAAHAPLCVSQLVAQLSIMENTQSI